MIHREKIPLPSISECTSRNPPSTTRSSDDRRQDDMVGARMEAKGDNSPFRKLDIGFPM